MQPLILTPGDPIGIGPEVTVKALHRWNDRPVRVLGHLDAVRQASEQLGLSLDLPHVTLQAPQPTGEPVEVAAIRHAVSDLQAGRGAALVTGPIHKGRLIERGFQHTGHTDFLAALCEQDGQVMAFVGGELRVALVTVHVPLRRVPDMLTPERILPVLKTTHAALQHDLGIERPRLLVCGLNPHAGDGGALGTEEITAISPAVEQARALGIDAIGPISAEAAFMKARSGGGDMVIAMYHDQGLAPLKAVDFGRSVNWTLGLPIIRTSVDHGTADDLVGRNLADESSMLAALSHAHTLATQRERRQG